MDNDKILEMLYAALNDQDIWFTTKKDPTFAEASSYYKLDEFGNLSKEAQKQVAKDINSYIGDGALDIIEAIDMWINDNLNAYKIAYKDNLVTKFKQAPVVDNIDAYEVKLESKLIESNNKQLIDISKKLFDQNHQLLVSSKEDVVNILNQINDDYIKNELIKWFYSKLNKDYSLKDAAFSTDSYMWGFINGDYKSPESAESYNNENLEYWIEYAQLGLNKGQSEDEIYMDILDQTGNSDLANDVIDSLDNLEESLNIIEEDKRSKLVKDIEKFGEETKYKDKHGNNLNVGDLIYLPNKGYHLLRYSDNGGYYLYRPSLGFRQGPTTSKNGELIHKYNEIADKPISNPHLDENKIIEDNNMSLNDLDREQAKLLDKELEDVLYILNKYSSDVNFKRAKVNIKISGDLNYDNSLDSDSKEAIQQKKVNFENFVNDMKANGYKDYGGTQDFNTHVIPFNNASGNAFVSLTKKLKDININVRFIMFVYGKTYNIDMKVKTGKLKTESVRTRMQEQNTKSANVISAMFTDPDFDADSKEGQIVMKTSELFNVLSEEGYDVQVFFDNGESQNVILLGDQGGQLNITITDANQPLRIYSSGNYEITQDNIKILQDVLNVIKKS